MTGFTLRFRHCVTSIRCAGFVLCRAPAGAATMMLMGRLFYQALGGARPSASSAGVPIFAGQRMGEPETLTA
jgi:hypothetical protein